MTINKEVTGQGPNIVLLHGWGCDLRHMQPLVDLLSDQYTVTNVDLPGRGYSHWKDSIENIDDFADSLLPELPEQAIYIAWSFGGLIAFSIASRFPERVTRIIGIGTTPKFIVDDNWPGVPQPGFKAGMSNIQEIGFNAFFKGYYDGEFSHDDTDKAAYDKLIQLLEESPENDINVLLKGVDIVDAADFREQFKTIQSPIDLILGTIDESVPLALHSHIQALNDNVQIHAIPQAQHMPFWTHPDAFNAILKNILK